MAEAMLVQDPFDYLEEDHKKVAKVLTELEESTERAEKARKEGFAELDKLLSLHAEAEEQILYPALEELKKTHEITMEAFEEHHVMKVLLKELSALNPQTEEWSAKLKVLKENVEHHVEEEEGDMFKKARGALSQEEKEELARKMNMFLAGKA